MLRRLHRCLEIRKVANAEDLVRRDWLQREFEFLEPGERAFRTDQQIGQIHLLASQAVDVVTGDVSRDLRVAPLDLCGVSHVELPHSVRQSGQPVATGSVAAAIAWRSHSARTAIELLAIGEHRLDPKDILDHVAVMPRARADAVVAGHATDSRPAGSRDVDREKQPVRLQECVQRI